MNRCRSCGAPLEADDRFCGDCGAPAAGCPGCGAAVLPGKRFCRSCGTPLALPAPAPPPGPAAPSASQVSTPGAALPVGAGPGGVSHQMERRVCSVLFCDMVGFTPLSEAMDPESVRELLSGYFDVARTVIGRYGGVVEKFIGDAVMAVWGAPRASESDAERAIRAGLDLVRAVADLGADAQIPGLSARAGVVTGEVAVALGAAGEGMVAGDAVNTAARVQAAATPGSVWTDAATRRMAEAAVAFAEAGSHVLRGKSEPIRLWEATRVLSAVGGVQRVDGLEAPLVGRDAELRTIRELFHAAADRRAARMVLISGPAGAGKSRLGWEFEKYTDGLASTLWWHRGQCAPYGEGAPFRALAQIIRQRLGIAEDDPAAEATRKFAAGLDRFIPDQAEREYAGSRLSRLLGLTLAGGTGTQFPREELFAGWRLFLERLAATSPVVLLIEDVENADPGLLDFLDYLADWSRGAAIFILLLARPELLLGRPGFGTGRNRVTLTLDPLDPASMNVLIDALVPGMPAGARAAVTAQAQGLPLFAVETIRSLIDHGIVTGTQAGYRLTGQVQDLAVPQTLHALLAARLDALPPGVRRLASDAAVLGTSFHPATLAGLTDADGGAIEAGLAELTRREVLTRNIDPLSPDRGSYQFTHHLLRQVAYDTLSRRDRKARHLAAASQLRADAAAAGDGAAELIARHYIDALNAVPGDPDAPAIRASAITALVRAAEHAEQAGAPGSAAASYASAARLTAECDSGDPDGDDHGTTSAGRLWELAAASATINGARQDALEYATLAGEFHQRRGDARGAARARVATGRVLRLQGKLSEARDQLTAALDVLSIDPDIDTVRALYQLGAAEVAVGAPDADARTTEALVLGQALAVEESDLADVLTLRGGYLASAGRNAEAAAHLREASRLGSHSARGNAQLNLADVIGVTDPAAAVEAASAAAGHLRQVGNRPVLAFALANLVQSLLMLGEWDSADAELARAADEDNLADNELLTCYRAWIAALRGDCGSADAILAELAEMPASEDPQDLAFIAVIRGFSAAARLRPGDALAHARAALDHATTIGIGSETLRWAWPLAARAAHDLADRVATADLLVLLDTRRPGYLPPMLRAERELARARTATTAGGPAAGPLRAAVVAMRAQSTPYHLAHALLDQAAGLLAAGDEQAGARAADEAREIAGRLGCLPLLSRAAVIRDAVMSGA
ncbi:MAG: AAA family ATPase [Streptosporangiaceae bacterium]